MTASAKNFRVFAALVLALAAGGAAATSDPLIGLLPPGGSGVGASLRYEPAPYIGADRNTDFLPLISYDSEYFYLQSYRAGLKLERGGWRGELFVKRRFEGFASDKFPTSMTGMEKRAIGGDVGVALQRYFGAGAAYAELLTDASSN